MSIPLRALCYYDNEGPDWWITLDRRTAERMTGERLRVPIQDLVCEAHGMNDPEMLRLFRMAQHARFHPATQ